MASALVSPHTSHGCDSTDYDIYIYLFQQQALALPAAADSWALHLADSPILGISSLTSRQDLTSDSQISCNHWCAGMANIAVNDIDEIAQEIEDIQSQDTGKQLRGLEWICWRASYYLGRKALLHVHSVHQNACLLDVLIRLASQPPSEIQARAAQCLSWLPRHPDFREKLAESHMPWVVSLLKSPLPIVQYSAAMMIMGMAIGKTNECSRRLVRLGAIPALAEVLSSPSHWAQLAAGYALQMLCAAWENREAIMRHGCFTPLTAMLHQQTGSGQQARIAAAVLIAAIPGPNRSLQHLLTSDDALPCLDGLLSLLITTTLDRFGGHPIYGSPGPPPVGIGSPAFQDKLADLISHMLQAMGKGWHPHAGEPTARQWLQQVSKHILTGMVLSNMIMMLRSDQPPMNLVALSAVSHVARCKSTAQEIIREDGLPAMVALLSSDEPRIQRAACQALQRMAASCNISDALIAGKALPVLQQMLNSPTAICTDAAQLLHAAACSATQQQALREMAEISISALTDRCHSTDPADVWIALQALGSLSGAPNFAKLLADADGLRALKAGLLCELPRRISRRPEAAKECALRMLVAVAWHAEPITQEALASCDLLGCLIQRLKRSQREHGHAHHVNVHHATSTCASIPRLAAEVLTGLSRRGTSRAHIAKAGLLPMLMGLLLPHVALQHRLDDRKVNAPQAYPLSAGAPATSAPASRPASAHASLSPRSIMVQMLPMPSAPASRASSRPGSACSAPLGTPFDPLPTGSAAAATSSANLPSEQPSAPAMPTTSAPGSAEDIPQGTPFDPLPSWLPTGPAAATTSLADLPGAGLSAPAAWSTSRPSSASRVPLGASFASSPAESAAARVSFTNLPVGSLSVPASLATSRPASASRAHLEIPSDALPRAPAAASRPAPQ